MLTVANLQQILSELPPDLEVHVGGAAVWTVLRFHRKGAPDYLSLDDDSCEYVEHLDPEDAAVLWCADKAFALWCGEAA